MEQEQFLSRIESHAPGHLSVKVAAIVQVGHQSQHTNGVNKPTWFTRSMYACECALATVLISTRGKSSRSSSSHDSKIPLLGVSSCKLLRGAVRGPHRFEGIHDCSDSLRSFLVTLPCDVPQEIGMVQHKSSE